MQGRYVGWRIGRDSVGWVCPPPMLSIVHSLGDKASPRVSFKEPNIPKFLDGFLMSGEVEWGWSHEMGGGVESPSPIVEGRLRGMVFVCSTAIPSPEEESVRVKGGRFAGVKGEIHDIPIFRSGRGSFGDSFGCPTNRGHFLKVRVVNLHQGLRGLTDTPQKIPSLNRTRGRNSITGLHMTAIG